MDTYNQMFIYYSNDYKLVPNVYKAIYILE